MSIISDEVGAFRTFISKGNVVDLAVAFVIGAAFQALISSLTTNLITPIIGVFGHFNFAGLAFTINGSTFAYGTFINSVISFAIISLAVFFLIVRPLAKIEQHRNRGKSASAPTTKTCPECLSTIPIAARRCAYCTTVLKSDSKDQKQKRNK